MNYFVLEGIGLCALYAVLFLFAMVSIGSIVCVIITDRRNMALEQLLSNEVKKVRILYRENFLLRLKNGEIDFDEK